jgi:alkylation response protein AidB-like acyl-CoA dehydrogenase|tara:strand:- start:1196 stop:2395 length:1200 start_codon:yes stop_codon:yes gene_type:complete
LTKFLNPDATDFSISLRDDHKEIQELARDFATNEVAPIANKIDEEDHIPNSLIKKMSELGFLGVPYPSEYGGAGYDYLSMAIVIEELARVSCAFSVIPVAHTLIAMPLTSFGTEDQKNKFLIPLAKGEKIGAHAMTEPGAGSDAAGISTAATKDGDDWIINGTKAWCTNGDIASTFLIFARTSDEKKRHLGISAFIVERDTDGFTVGNSLPKTGIRGSQSVELVLDNVKVPNTNILGEEGKGFYVAMDCYDHGRIEIAAQGVGVGQAAIESASKYISQRIAFGQPIMEFQGPQFMLAEVAAEIQASRLLTYWAASLRDQGRDFVSAAAIAKMYATEAGERAALTAIKLGGSAGVAKEYPMERYLRDIQVTKIYEGTNDIQRVTLGKLLYKETKKELGLN